MLIHDVKDSNYKSGDRMPTEHDNEFYTQEKYILAAVEVMGSIDLDPASCEIANKTVMANNYFDIRDDGLKQRWDGNIWLNPPYGRIEPEKKGQTISFQMLFIEKLLAEYSNGNVKQAIALLSGSSCFMRWFEPLCQFPLVLHVGDVWFTRPNGANRRTGFGTVFVYLGENKKRFIYVFKRFGRSAPNGLVV